MIWIQAWFSEFPVKQEHHWVSCENSNHFPQAHRKQANVCSRIIWLELLAAQILVANFHLTLAVQDLEYILVLSDHIYVVHSFTFYVWLLDVWLFNTLTNPNSEGQPMMFRVLHFEYHTPHKEPYSHVLVFNPFQASKNLWGSFANDKNVD